MLAKEQEMGLAILPTIPRFHHKFRRIAIRNYNLSGEKLIISQ